MSTPTSAEAGEPSAPPTGVDGIGPVLSEAWGDVVDQLAATWKAGVPLTIALSLYMTLGTVLAMTAVLAVSAALGAALGVAALPVAIAVAIGVVCIYLLVGAVITAPFTQAMFRAHWQHHQDDLPLGVMDGMRGAARSMSLNLAIVALISLQSIGYLMLFLPGVIVDAALGFVVPAMVIHELPLHRAVGRSLTHFARAPAWHIGLALVDGLVATALNGLVPVLGGLVSMPLNIRLQLRAYLDAFPADERATPDAPGIALDAEEPVAS